MQSAAASASRSANSNPSNRTVPLTQPAPH
jgi:hypothetical protein